MAMYYGLTNSTKNISVSSYWKGNPPSVEEVLFMIDYFQWKSGDYISSGCYCECSYWGWDAWDWSDFFNPGSVNSDNDSDSYSNNKVRVTYRFPYDAFKQYKKTKEMILPTQGELDLLSKNVDKTFFWN